jgi:uncharacterized Fe-S center protein
MAKVLFSSLKNKSSVSPLNKIKKMMNRCGAKEIYGKDDFVAIKLHFGELGNTAFLRPVFLRPVIEVVKTYGARPYLTDTNTLYAGMRWNAVDHLHNANLNGFNYATLQTPVIIADGLRGDDMREVPIPGGKLAQTAKIATGILNADALVVVSHFKGHELTGFGGAIKNLAMGCAARGGKLAMHSVSKPEVNKHKCTACGRCKSVCQVGAITISGTATITEKCTGCVRCVGICPEEAIFPKFDNAGDNVQKMLAEYAKAVTSSFEKPIIYINVLTSIVPACDCMPGNDEPVTRDLGFMASTDPLAIDRASFDMVKESCGGKDPFEVSGEPQLEHAELLVLGSSKYELEKVD